MNINHNAIVFMYLGYAQLVEQDEALRAVKDGDGLYHIWDEDYGNWVDIQKIQALLQQLLESTELNDPPAVLDSDASEYADLSRISISEARPFANPIK